MKPDTKSLTVYLPDTRGVAISRYGKGNMKIGMEVFTYSRMPGLPSEMALGYTRERQPLVGEFDQPYAGTCPGATTECLAICYARRPVAEGGLVRRMWFDNSQTADVPPIPDECRLLRIHVAGDFDTLEYIENWIRRLQERPDVTAFAYTRSWRVPALLPSLERLHALSNVQLFASVDTTTTEDAPEGWRRAWIEGDDRLLQTTPHNYVVKDGSATPGYLCPEQTKRRRDCVECGFCIHGKKNDVVFLKH